MILLNPIFFRIVQRVIICSFILPLYGKMKASSSSSLLRNPITATHPRMTPTDLKLAQKECSQLLKQGLIEPIDLEWACQAFYVEKMFEIVRGKKRLAIDYQPLNYFLRDDKFPLPKIQSLFVHIRDGNVFSKFDLKAGF